MRTIIPPYHETLDENDKVEDFFNRGDFQQNLTNLLTNTEEPLVVGLNARWGEGKTTFIKLWERDLMKNKSDLIPIYYDAFKNDFTDEVFISLAVSIQREIDKYYKSLGENYTKKREEEIKAYKAAAKELGKKLISVAGGTATKFLSLGAFDSSELIEQAFDKAEKFDKHKIFELIDDKYDSFLDMEQTIKDYRESLKKLLEIEEGVEKKIVFFVDELDRCKPLFAVEVIEKIKHLFSISGVHFVLAINKDQLLSAIKNAYGVEEHAGAYLQKFVHIEAELPSFNQLRTSEELSLYFEYLLDGFEFDAELIDRKKVLFLIAIINQIGTLNVVPRSVERWFTLFSIVYKSVDKTYLQEHWRKLLFLTILKIEAYSVYTECRIKKTITRRFWRDQLGRTNLGGLQQHLENKFFEQSEYERINVSSSEEFRLKGFEKAFEYVDMYSLPTIF